MLERDIDGLLLTVLEGLEIAPPDSENQDLVRQFVEKERAGRMAIVQLVGVVIKDLHRIAEKLDKQGD